jgi:hypothetical protein
MKRLTVRPYVQAIKAGPYAGINYGVMYEISGRTFAHDPEQTFPTDEQANEFIASPEGIDLMEKVRLKYERVVAQH